MRKTLKTCDVPKYDYFGLTDYADIIKFLGLKSETTAELVEAGTAVYELIAIGIEMNLKAQGVTKQVLDTTVDRMAELAYEDQCTTANWKNLDPELKKASSSKYTTQSVSLDNTHKLMINPRL